MRKTVVRCSVPGCGEPATAKVAAPWSYGRFTEYKTYGFSCPDHVNEMLRYGEQRFKPPTLAEGETLGPVESRELPDPLD